MAESSLFVGENIRTPPWLVGILNSWRELFEEFWQSRCSSEVIRVVSLAVLRLPAISCLVILPLLKFVSLRLCLSNSPLSPGEIKLCIDSSFELEPPIIELKAPLI